MFDLRNRVTIIMEFFPKYESKKRSHDALLYRFCTFFGTSSVNGLVIDKE